jgi:hypothetical protein
MYMIAGHIAEVLGGKPFETLIKEKIWDPLGMNESHFLDDVSWSDEHFALPYFLINGTLNFTDDDLLLYRLVHVLTYKLFLIFDVRNLSNDNSISLTTIIRRM